MGKIGIQCIFPPILRVQMAFMRFSVLLYLFQTTSQKSRQDEEEHILPALFRQEDTFSQTFEKMPASQSWHPVLR